MTFESYTKDDYLGLMNIKSAEKFMMDNINMKGLRVYFFINKKDKFYIIK